VEPTRNSNNSAGEEYDRIAPGTRQRPLGTNSRNVRRGFSGFRPRFGERRQPRAWAQRSPEQRAAKPESMKFPVVLG
jgi:hypothetical protein